MGDIEKIRANWKKSEVEGQANMEEGKAGGKKHKRKGKLDVRWKEACKY